MFNQDTLRKDIIQVHVNFDVNMYAVTAECIDENDFAYNITMFNSHDLNATIQAVNDIYIVNDNNIIWHGKAANDRLKR